MSAIAASPSTSVALSANPVATNEASSQQAQPKINEITTHVKRLNDIHYKECVEKRGLDPEWIRVNCESFNKKQASERLGYPAQSEGIWLEGANGFGQFRPNKAWKSKEEKASKKQAAKYRCATKEEIDAMLPKHPTNPQYWEDLVELAKLCWVIDGKACLVITEGMFKAIMGCQHGIPTIALAGVWQGFTKKDWAGRKHLVDTLYRLAGTGKFGFIIIFDADANTNKNIVAATRELAHGLSKAKVPVYIGTGLWNESEGKGMDDFIKKCGIDRFKREVMGKVVDLSTWEKQFKKDDSHKPKKLNNRDFAKQLEDDYRSRLAWNIPAKAWYMYDSKIPGVWSKTPHETILKLVANETITRGIEADSSYINGVISLMKGFLSINDWEVMPGYVCLEDCVVNIKTLEYSPHEPGFRFLSALPFKWSDRSIGCQPILDWLLDACDGRDKWVEVIRAAMNATITGTGDKYQRFVELHGPGGTGKGTLVRLLEALLGKENYKGTDFKLLESNRFETANFYQKKAIFIRDSERFAGQLSNFKKVTGDDGLRNENKNVDPGDDFNFTGVAWVLANDVIQSQEYYSNAMTRRRLSIPFTKVIPPHLQRDLMAEFAPYLPGLLYWVLSMDRDAVREYFKNTNKTVPSLANYSLEVLMATNPLAAWADESIVYREGFVARIGRKTDNAETFLYPNYCEWAYGMGLTPLSQVKFSGALLNLVQNELHLKVDKPKRNKAYGNHFVNISLRLPGHNDPLLISHSIEKNQGCRVGYRVDPELEQGRCRVGVELVEGNKIAETIDISSSKSKNVDLGAELSEKQVSNTKEHHHHLHDETSPWVLSREEGKPCTSEGEKQVEALQDKDCSDLVNSAPTLHQVAESSAPNPAPEPDAKSLQALPDKDGVELGSLNTNPAPISNGHQEAREQGALSRGEGSISPLPPAHFPPASSGHQVKEGDIITAKLLPTDAAPRQGKVTKVEETGVWAATGTCEYFVKWENIQAVNSQLTQKWWEQRLDN